MQLANARIVDLALAGFDGLFADCTGRSLIGTFDVSRDTYTGIALSKIAFGVSQNVEYIAHSFTRSATGINRVREIPGVVESGAHIIAKIESQEGLDNFESILRCCDGIMVRCIVAVL